MLTGRQRTGKLGHGGFIYGVRSNKTNLRCEILSHRRVYFLWHVAPLSVLDRKPAEKQSSFPHIDEHAYAAPLSRSLPHKMFMNA
jgi:hypothetical protein